MINPRIFFIFFLSSIALSSIFFLWNTLFPFLIGLLFAYLLDPLVSFLEKKNYFKLDRNRIVILISLIFILALFYLFSWLFNYLQPNLFISLFQKIQEYHSLLQKKYASLIQKIQSYSPMIPYNSIISPEIILNKSLIELQTFFKNFIFSLNSILKQIFSSLLSTVITFISTFYFLKDKYKIFALFDSYIKTSRKIQIKHIFHEINSNIGGYIKGQFLISLIVILFVSLGLLFLPPLRPYSFLFAIIAGVTNIIPYVGPIIGSIPPIALAFNYYSIDTIILLILAFSTFNFIVGMIITPKILSSKLNIHPLLVIVTISIGNALFGIPGMILAIPLTIILKIVIKLIFQNYIHKL